MNISLFGQSPCSILLHYGRQERSASLCPGAGREGFASAYGTSEEASDNGKAPDPEKKRKTEQLRQLIRELNRSTGESGNSYSGERANGFTELTGTGDKEKEEPEKPVNYNYKEIASKIQRAKTSVSAEQAVLSAKRKVLEVKRKISAGDGDAEELQMALTHAERMEMVARKKKHHLELEELSAVTQKRYEEKDRREEAAFQMKDALFAREEEKIAEEEDAVFEKRESLAEEASERVRREGGEAADPLLKELNETLSELGEEELKKLEEVMEAFEGLEVIDPHMSREDLEELKRRHRAAENKALVKADMDYLKGMIRHQLEKGGSMLKPVGNSAFSGVFSGTGTVSAGFIEALIPKAEGTGGGLVDIQV